MAAGTTLARVSLLLALLASVSCAARPPSQAIVVPLEEGNPGQIGEDLESSVCQRLCTTAEQDQPVQRCYTSRGWSYHQYLWMVCHYGRGQ